MIQNMHKAILARINAAVESGGGGGTVSYGSAGAASAVVGNVDIDLAAPASISDGDLLIAVVFDDTDQALTGLDGFTPINSVTSSSSRLSVLKKIASSESGDYTFTSASSDKGGMVFRVSKDSGTWDTATNSTNSDDTTAYIDSTAVTTTDGSLLLIASGSDDVMTYNPDPTDMSDIPGTALNSGRIIAWYQEYATGATDVVKRATSNSVKELTIIAVVIKAT